LQGLPLGIDSPVDAGKPSERNVEPAPDALASERKVDVTTELVGEETADYFRSITGPIRRLNDRAARFLPFDA
jgi:hypothetical protein